ncbi:MAG: flagellar export chaperone FliS [Nitrospirae bacterium]|nr:flagellar export chaperone FliS [Candidatus Manganitrophaceae bacterium]
MNLSSNYPMNAYVQASLETAAPSADPHKLILMLFDGAIESVHSANEQILKGNFSEKGRAISKAIAIIGELAGSLNYEVGGEIAASLGLLYAHMTLELLDASAENKPEGISHVGQLLSELRSGWEAISPKQPTLAEIADEPPTPQQVAVSYGKV